MLGNGTHRHVIERWLGKVLVPPMATEGRRHQRVGSLVGTKKLAVGQVADNHRAYPWSPA